MIGRIHGKLLEKTPPQILVEAAGLGYEVDVPMSTFCNLPAEGNDVTLYTHFVVREDAMLLYGFLTASERETFRALLKVSGIGPRIALALLSGMTPDALANAVERGEAGLLTRVSGVGKKTAERILLELKGKLHGSMTGAGAVPDDGRADIVSALIALGYSDRDAEAAAKRLPEGTSVSDGIRQALKMLAR